jgi:osmoprotectant transport system permease protein
MPPRFRSVRLLAALLVLTASSAAAFLRAPSVRAADTSPVVVGSKKFTESYVLGEIARMQLERAGIPAEHRKGIGATGIVWEALRTGSISAYPEYTGTIREEILKSKEPMTDDAMRAALATDGVAMGGDLGFDDTYALVMRHDTAARLGIRTIDDLRAHPDLRVSVSNEFLERHDGWKPLAEKYGLTALQPHGIEHGLAYAALSADRIDLTDAYSTDAGIAKFGLVVLQDDQHFFPEYKAVFLYRKDMSPAAVAALRKLEGTISDTEMTKLNALAESSTDYTKAAASYFGKDAAAAESASAPSYLQLLLGWTLRHLYLVGVSLFFAILVGIPLGIVASRGGTVSTIILGVVGVIQTIPSLALLAFLVPLLGISPASAIVALFLYSLLPIVRSTATGLTDIAPGLRESAAALGLSPAQQLMRVYLPLASRSILSGIKTSAVINVGTATIAALIGAGGLGEPIISGLSLNDNRTILEGAIPAAILALLVQGGFDLLDRVFIPRGLRLAAPRG